MKKTVNVIIFALLLVIFGSYMFTFKVRQDQVAFVDTFGDISPPIEEPGLQFRLPWPIQQVYTFDKRIHVKTTDYSQITTGDGSLIVQAYFGWRIGNPKVFMEKSKGKNDAERQRSAEANLEREVEGAVSTVFGGEKNLTEKFEVNLASLFEGESGTSSDDKPKHTYKGLEEKIKDKVSESAREYGMELEFVGIRRVGVSEQGVATILEAMVTQWTNASLSASFQAQEEAKHITNKANDEKESALERARLEAERIINAADAKYEELFSKMETEDAKLAELLLKLSTMEKILKKEATLLLDENVPFLEGMREDFLKEFLRRNEAGEPDAREEDGGEASIEQAEAVTAELQQGTP